MHSDGHITSVVFLPQIHNLNLIMRKYQTNPNWGTFYKIIDQNSSKLLKADWGCVLDVGDEEDSAAKYNVRFWIGSWKSKTTLLEKRVRSKVCHFVNSSVAMLITYLLFFFFWCCTLRNASELTSFLSFFLVNFLILITVL